MFILLTIGLILGKCQKSINTKTVSTTYRSLGSLLFSVNKVYSVLHLYVTFCCSEIDYKIIKISDPYWAETFIFNVMVYIITSESNKAMLVILKKYKNSSGQEKRTWH